MLFWFTLWHRGAGGFLRFLCFLGWMNIGFFFFFFLILIPSFRQTSGVGVLLFWSYLLVTSARLFARYQLGCVSYYLSVCVVSSCLVLIIIISPCTCMLVASRHCFSYIPVFCFTGWWVPGPEKGWEKGKKNLLSATVSVKCCYLSTFLSIYILSNQYESRTLSHCTE